MSIKFTDYVPYTLVGVNSASKTLAAEAVTGLPLSTGAAPDSSFWLDEKQANLLSSSTQVCHEGWYRVVQVDSAATAANIAFGYVGAMLKISTGTLASPAGSAIKVVTSYDKALANGLAPVVFLGTVTPGNWTIVQDTSEGEGTVQTSSGSGSLGAVLIAQTSGSGQATTLGATAITGSNYPQILAIAEAAWVATGLVRCRYCAPGGNL